MRSLMVPFSLIVATVASYAYYQQTKNMIISLLIGLLGPLILNLILKFFLKTMSTSEGSQAKPGFLSRVGGSILTLIWGWVFIIFTLLLLAFMPAWGDNLKTLHNDVTRSISYSIIKPWKENFFPSSPQQNTSEKIPSATAASGADIKSLADDPRFQKIMQDPEVQAEINAHDIVRLMSNPKMMELTKEIMSDPATMQKLMAVYSSTQKQLPPSSSTTEPSQ